MLFTNSSAFGLLALIFFSELKHFSIILSRNPVSRQTKLLHHPTEKDIQHSVGKFTQPLVLIFSSLKVGECKEGAELKTMHSLHFHSPRNSYYLGTHFHLGLICCVGF